MENFDVITIGGGPAGTTLSTLLAKVGHRVLLLEHSQFPRYHVGESLLPATVKEIAQLLGLEQVFRQADFIVKRGATFSWGSNPETPWTMNFGRTPPGQMILDPGAPYAYNVSRATFDQLLLDNAVRHTVEVRQGCRVQELVEEKQVIRGVKYLDASGEMHLAASRFVVDASGQRSLLSKRIGKRELSRFFEKIAVWGYFVDGRRLEVPLDGNVLFQADDNAWIWYIPLNERLTSVGVVVPTNEFNGKKSDAEHVLQGHLESCPLISELLKNAALCREHPYDEIRVCSEYSYCHTQFWTPGALMIGDAACFVDVLLSSGVHLATYAALLAARSINSVLNQGLPEVLCMNEFETRLRREYAIFYDGLLGLYDMGLDANTYTQWLRALLQQTNGVFIEMQEEKAVANGAKVSDSELLQRSQENIAAMRQYNADQMRYDGLPAMGMPAMPEALPTLTRGSECLIWLK